MLAAPPSFGQVVHFFLLLLLLLIPGRKYIKVDQVIDGLVVVVVGVGVPYPSFPFHLFSNQLNK